MFLLSFLEYSEHNVLYKGHYKDNDINFEEIDIEGKTEKEFLDFFKDKNIIHLEGGSTFYLLRIMKKTGFDKLLLKLLEEGKVYIGTSAGAAVMGVSIKSSSGIPENPTEEMLSGLNIVPFIIQAHYTDDKKEQYKEKTKDVRYPVKYLRDGQGFLVEDDEYTFLGDGEEVVIE